MHNINSVGLVGVESFQKLFSKSKFPKLKDFALKINSMCGSTYVCESTFLLWSKSNVEVQKSNGRRNAGQ